MSSCPEPAAGGLRCRTRDLLHILNARHGAQSRVIPGALPQVSKPTADELAARLAPPDAPQGRNGQRLRVRIMCVTSWSYGDSNPWPLACHTNSARRHMWLDVALRGAHLRLPWLYVAWRRLVSLHVGSPPGSQNSLAPLTFEAPATVRSVRSRRHRRDTDRWPGPATVRIQARPASSA
jgi:hypothetical protein